MEQILPNEFSPLFYHLAQIAMEMRRTINPRKRLKVEDFIFKFGKKEYKKPRTQKQKDAHIATSKAAWAGILVTSKVRKPPKFGPA